MEGKKEMQGKKNNLKTGGKVFVRLRLSFSLTF